MPLFEFINSQRPNIKFTFEKQNDGKLFFWIFWLTTRRVTAFLSFS